MSEEIRKLALGTLKLREAYSDSMTKIAELEGDLSLMNKRARAEEILLKAQGTNTQLRASTVEEFLAKRANLETHSFEELDRISASLDLFEEDGEIRLSDYDGDLDKKASLNEWLLSQATRY